MRAIAEVLQAGRWRSTEDRHMRARLMEERARLLEVESAKREEKERAAAEEKARRSILSIGRAEYLPVAGSSAEVWEQARKNAWHKHLGNWHYNPKAVARNVAIWKALNKRWLEREERKSAEFYDALEQLEQVVP